MTRLLARAGFALLIAMILAYSLLPLYWALISSLKPPGDLFQAELLPGKATLENYRAVLAERSFGRSILNSLGVAAATVGIGLVLACGAGFALGRLRMRGRGLLLGALLAASMLPQVAVLAGMFEMVRAFGLYDNLAALVLFYLSFTLPFAIWMITTFMRDLPPELEDAAALDGAGPLYILARILLPILAPAIAATGLLAMMTAWNEFLFALTFTLTDAKRTVPVAIALISGASAYELPWGRIMAASMIVTLPLGALALVFQRRIVSGLTAGAIKS